MQNSLKRSGLLIIAKLISLLGGFGVVIILAVLNGYLGFISSMSVTLFGALGIAKLLGADIAMSYEVIITLVVVSGVLRGVLRYFEQYSNHYIAFKLLEIIRVKVFHKLRELVPAKLEGKQKGDLISMLTADIETLEVFYAHTISPSLIAFLVSLTVILFVGFFSSWYLSLLAFLGYVIVGIVLPLIFFKVVKKEGRQYRKSLADFNSYFLDSIKGIKEIVFHNNEKEREEKVSQKSENLLKTTKNIKNKVSASSAITDLTVTLFILLSLILGVVLYVNELLEFGSMLVGVVAIFGSFGPVLALANLPSNLTQTFASGDRVLDLLEEEPLVLEIKDKNDITFNSLEVKNLSFGYNNNDSILENVNFSVKKGEIVGIVGLSGSGKSTILNLLLRVYQKNSGEILFDGQEIEEVNSKSLLENVTLVSQSTYLFNESIMENIKVSKLNATSKEVVEATSKANIHSYIESLENGYKTEVKVMGDNLSSGEKQRIGISRAFLKNSPLILLDEPTSNVDSINEGIILSSIKEAKKDHAIILVSHRESTMAIADRIYRFDKKTLSEVKK